MLGQTHGVSGAMWAVSLWGPGPFLFKMDPLVGALWRCSELCDGGLEATDGARGQHGGEYAAELASLVFGPQGPGPFFLNGSSSWGLVTVVRAL